MKLDSAAHRQSPGKGHDPGMRSGTLVSMKRYVITGAPGTGKAALVESLSHLGHVVGEPARELISEHRAATGERSLDGSPKLFLERLITRSIEKFDAAADLDVVIYDRALPDCVAYAGGFDVDATDAIEAATSRRYSNPVFVAPPWEAIYTVDDMRRATFDQVVAFHLKLVTACEMLRYELIELPRAPVSDRVDVIAQFM